MILRGDLCFQHRHNHGEAALHCPGSIVCISLHASQVMCALQAQLVELWLTRAQDLETALLCSAGPAAHQMTCMLSRAWPYLRSGWSNSHWRRSCRKACGRWQPPWSRCGVACRRPAKVKA